MSKSETFWDYVDPSAMTKNPFPPAEEPSFSLHEERLALAVACEELAAAKRSKKKAARPRHKNERAHDAIITTQENAEEAQEAFEKKQLEEEEEKVVEKKYDNDGDQKEDEWEFVCEEEGWELV